MSYTAPQYVDTKEQAVLALASTIAGEDKTALGDGSVNTALDVLADVLAGQDVEVPQTNAGAILALAQYVGGGGGAEIGQMQGLTISTSETAPVVGGEDTSRLMNIDSVLIGDKQVAWVASGNISAAPVDASVTAGTLDSISSIIAAYSVMTELDGTAMVYKTVEQIQLDVEYDAELQVYLVKNIPLGQPNGIGSYEQHIVLHVALES